MTASTRTLLLDRVASPIGEILLACDDDGALLALDFHDHEDRMRRLLGRYHGPVTLRPGRAPAAITRALDAFFGNDLDALAHVPVRTAGTDFQQRVWTALRDIPSGATTTYGALAAAIGRPGASRAVGLANGSNPVALVLPCHRVIGSDGGLTGYGGGLERKRWLLEHERSAMRGQRASA